MDLVAPFLREGMLGAIIVVLAGVIAYLTKKLDYKDRLINELQDKRVIDANQFSSNFTTIAKDMVATNKDLASQNTLLQKGLDTLAQAFQNFVNTIGRGKS